MTDTTEPEVADQEPSGVPGIPTDWPQQATTRLVDVVDTVRVKTSGPAIRVSRAVVYGLVGLILGLVATPLLLVGLTRLLNYAIPGDIWRVYLLVGAVFTLLGLLFWSRRPRGAAKT